MKHLVCFHDTSLLKETKGVFPQGKHVPTQLFSWQIQMHSILTSNKVARRLKMASRLKPSIPFGTSRAASFVYLRSQSTPVKFRMIRSEIFGIGSDDPIRSGGESWVKLELVF